MQAIDSAAMRFWRGADGAFYMINDETTHAAKIDATGAHKWTPTPGAHVGRKIHAAYVPQDVLDAAVEFCKR